MQKTLRKPENWQDFESLCKKLWGELWDIPHRIKKNGRLGQSQHGVDVYGIPNGKNGYWGIQCKGKSDDYFGAILSKKEIDREINNAKKFSPALEVFIIATTQSKDAIIEEYIREKDLENRNLNSFEIILFCWEDIVDLIQENRETLNWYLEINKYREKYDFDVAFENNSDKITVKPKFLKEITKYGFVPSNFETSKGILNMSKQVQMFMNTTSAIYRSNKINKSWCSLKIVLTNTGNITLENWYLKLKINEARKIKDNFNVPFNLRDEMKRMIYESRTLWGNDETKTFFYRPISDKPLVQKSVILFEVFFIPNFDQEVMRISWELLARDFNKSGVLEIDLEPDFKKKTKYVKVEECDHLKEDTIEVKELIEKQKVL